MSILISLVCTLLSYIAASFRNWCPRSVIGIVLSMGWAIDANIDKWGRIIVGLLCLIAVVVWLSGVLGLGGGLPHLTFR